MKNFSLAKMLKQITMFRRLSLTTRLSMVSIIVVISSLLVVGSGLIYIAADAYGKSTVILQNKYAEKVASMISDYIISALDDLKLIDNLGILKTGNYAQHNKILENLIIYKGSIFSQIVMADSAGNEKIKISRYHTYMSHEYKNLSSSYIFTTAMTQGFHITPIYISGESGLLSVQVAVRTLNRNRVNVIIAELNITKLWQDISEVRIGSTGYAYLVDRSGKYIASQHPADVFKKHGINVIDIPPVAAFCSGMEYSEHKQYTGIDGKKVIGSYATIPGTD